MFCICQLKHLCKALENDDKSFEYRLEGLLKALKDPVKALTMDLHKPFKDLLESPKRLLKTLKDLLEPLGPLLSRTPS